MDVYVVSREGNSAVVEVLARSAPAAISFVLRHWPDDFGFPGGWSSHLKTPRSEPTPWPVRELGGSE